MYTRTAVSVFQKEIIVVQYFFSDIFKPRIVRMQPPSEKVFFLKMKESGKTTNIILKMKKKNREREILGQKSTEISK